MSSFRVGQKVVCVDAAGSEKVKEGTVYTVTWVSDWPAISGLDGCVVSRGLALAEVEANGIGFDARRFRPVVERKTNITIFKAMLTPSRVEEHA